MVDDPNRPDDNSFMDEDDFLAADRFGGDEGTPDTGAPAAKPNLKEIWAQNPSLKIFAGVAVVAIFLIAYLVFGSNNNTPKEEEQSMVRPTAEVSQPPGTAELPPAYEEAVRQESERRAKEAETGGGSAIPTPIARPSERIEAPVQVEENDPLSEWRKEAEARRIDRQKDGTETTTTPDATPPKALPQNSPAVNTGAQQTAEAAPPPLPTAPSPEMVQAMTQQLQQQMQTIMETQVPKESVVVSMNIQPGYDMKKYFAPEQQQTGQATTSGTAQGGGALPVGTTPPKPIIAAGTIAYAQVLTQANSDIPGPVLAEIASGPLLGGRAIGQFSVAEEHLVLQFNRVVKDGVEYPVQAFALDPGTTLPGVATDVDNHYFRRVFLPAAANFIQGFADAAAQTDTKTVVVDNTVVSDNTNDLNTRQELLQGVNAGAQRLSQIIDQSAERPVTVKVAAGTRIGLLFLSSVVEPNGQNQVQNQNQNGGQSNGYSNVIGQAYNAYSNYSNNNTNGNGGYGNTNSGNGYNSGYNNNNSYTNGGYNNNSYNNNNGYNSGYNTNQNSTNRQTMTLPRTNFR